MTKTKKFVIYTLCIILTCFTLGLISMPKSIASADSADISTLFVRNESMITNNSTSLFVYDDVDDKIKVLDYNSDEILTIETQSPLALASTDSYLFILTASELKAYDLSNLQAVSLENLSGLSNFSLYSSISLLEITSTEILMLLTPKIVTSANLTILSINLASNQITESSEITFTDTFKTENLAEGISSANIISKNDTSLQILLQSATHFFTFTLNLSTLATIDTWTTLTLDSESVYSRTTTIDGETIIITLSENKLSYFTFNMLISPPTNLLTETEVSDIKNMSIYGDNLVLTDDSNSFKATVYSLSKTDSEPYEITATVEKVFENQSIDLNMREAAEIDFFELTSDAFSYKSPTTKEGTLLGSGTHVALLSVPTVEGNDFGYSYCLAVDGTTNILGFIDSSLLSPLSETTFEHNFVYVIDGTNLYSLPSNVTSEADGNLITAKISMNDKVKIISTLSDAKMGGREYLLVEVNGNIGFILRDRVSSKYTNYNLVLTNAYLKSGVNVYEKPDSTSEVIGKLAAGDRLRVLTTRRIDSEFLEVKYNDLDGNEITGYVLSSAVETDSWSMLQILGMVLVVINLIFLIIILAVRKKINKD